jgi:photosystem II stability/assembly factor-like uncharacterized protein
VLAHAPEPVLATEDGGRTWSATGPGLRAEQVLHVYAAPDDAWWASRSRGGLVRYDAGKKAWKQAGTVVGSAADTDVPSSRFGGVAGLGARHAVLLQPATGASKPAGKATRGSRPLQNVVTDMAFSSKDWYAATSSGLLISADRGGTWTLKPVGALASLPVQSVRVSSNGERIRAVSLRGLVFSEDGGNSWTWHDLPVNSGGAITLEGQPGEGNTVVAIAHKGLYISQDAGKTWQQAALGLPAVPVERFAARDGVFVASMRTGGLYVSSDSGRTWDRVPGTLADGFFAALAPSDEPGLFFAASATDGLNTMEWPGSTQSDAGVSGRPQKKTAREEASPRN